MAASPSPVKFRDSRSTCSSAPKSPACTASTVGCTPSTFHSFNQLESPNAEESVLASPRSRTTTTDSNGGQVKHSVLRVGLKQRVRPSQLLTISTSLENNGYTTRKALKNLTDEVATQLKIPLEFAAALREDANAMAPWVKVGPLPPAQRIEPYTLAQQGTPGPGVGPQIRRINHISGGFPTFESTSPRDSKAVWMGATYGFPGQLRCYTPRSTPVQKNRDESPSPSLLCRSSSRESSPASRRAYDNHVARQSSARDLRERDRSVGSDPWMASSSNRRGSSAVFSGKPVRRCIAGYDNPRRCAELTRDVAPTLPDQTSLKEQSLNISPSNCSSTVSIRDRFRFPQEVHRMPLRQLHLPKPKGSEVTKDVRSSRSTSAFDGKPLSPHIALSRDFLLEQPTGSPREADNISFNYHGSPMLSIGSPAQWSNASRPVSPGTLGVYSKYSREPSYD
eukprot:TRINITY_DN11592_c0_g3_i1.p1 TRINITY_DN11592_c0_g3~~TRINITY_DN11592_c0_g3_i1.p1  ORF type:complete len:451 (+),score=34.84 TRINITY_DN11592_c0_g3_i1:52-1404(+)